MTAVVDRLQAGVLARVPTSRRWLLVPLGIFLLGRVLSTILLVHAADTQHVRIAAGPEPVIDPVDTVGYSEIVSNWDGQWYRLIATSGYPSQLPRVDGEVGQNPWIFAPLYPALVRLVMAVTQLPFGWAASLLSLACTAAATCVLFVLLEQTSTRWGAILGVLTLTMSPASAVLQAAYAEGLALLLIVWSLSLLRRRRYLAVAPVAVALALTRPLTWPLAAVVAVHLLVRWRSRGDDPFPRSERLAGMVALVVAVGAIAIWPVVAALSTGTADAYVASRGPWVRHGSQTWLRAVIGGDPGVAAVVVIGVLLLAAVLLGARRKAWALELRVWSLTYTLFVVATTGTGAGFVRYALLGVIPWWPLPPLPGERASRLGRAATVVLVVVGGAVLQYLWVGRVFAITERRVGFP